MGVFIDPNNRASIAAKLRCQLELSVFGNCLLSLAMALCLSTSALAHDINTTTLLIRPSSAGWVLDMRFPADAANLALRDGEQSRPWSTVEKEGLVDHIKETVHFSANGAAVSLGKGGIRLGGHESVLTFELVGMPAVVDGLHAEATVFSTNAHHHNIVRFTDGQESAYVVLKEANGFSGWVVGPPPAFGLTTDLRFLGVAIGLVCLGLAGGGALFWTRRRSGQSKLIAD